MPRSLPLLALLGLALAACAGPAPVATDPAEPAMPATTATAAARHDAAVAALAAGYFSLVPESATYNGAPDAQAFPVQARIDAGTDLRFVQLGASTRRKRATS